MKDTISLESINQCMDRLGPMPPMLELYIQSTDIPRLQQCFNLINKERPSGFNSLGGGFGINIVECEFMPPGKAVLTARLRTPRPNESFEEWLKSINPYCCTVINLYPETGNGQTPTPSEPSLPS